MAAHLTTGNESPTRGISRLPSAVLALCFSFRSMRDVGLFSVCRNFHEIGLRHEAAARHIDISARNFVHTSALFQRYSSTVTSVSITDIPKCATVCITDLLTTWCPLPDRSLRLIYTEVSDLSALACIAPYIRKLRISSNWELLDGYQFIRPFVERLINCTTLAIDGCTRIISVAIASDCPALQHLTLSLGKSLELDSLELHKFLKSNHLQTICFMNFVVTHDHFTTLASMVRRCDNKSVESLHTLVFEDCNVFPDPLDWTVLAGCSGLQHICVRTIQHPTRKLPTDKRISYFLRSLPQRPMCDEPIVSSVEAVRIWPKFRGVVRETQTLPSMED